MPAPDLMLAQRGRPDSIEFLTKRGFAFELKIDGVRCFTEVDDGKVTMWSRRGENITTRYPEVSSYLRGALPFGRWELDGELAVADERGLPSWPLTHKRNAKGATGALNLPATYHVFDLLHMGPTPTSVLDFEHRRMAIERAIEPHPRMTPVLHTDDGHALWTVVNTHSLEGMVAKRLDSRYRPGRSGDWIKIKRTSTVSCLVGGFDEGKGARAKTFGALHLFLLDGERNLVPVGKVGSGFSDKELVEVNARMRESSIIVEVEYLDVSPDGQLRQPVFLRVREDQQITDCTTDQLEVG